MIALIKGKLVQKSSTEIIVDCSGVGYQINVSLNTSAKLPEIDETVKLFTILIPREDSLNLYGFYDINEKDAFKILISISGVGPKVALGILSSVSVDELQHYIILGNTNALQKLPGMGKKTAERLMLELKDKINKISVESTGNFSIEQSTLKQEVLSALLTLGYSRPVAEKAINSALSEQGQVKLTSEQLIKLSLKYALM